MSDDEPINPEQARFFAKVRRLMMIASVTTFIALALVMGIIGYRVFRGEGSAREAEVTVHLPKGARVVSTVVAGAKIVVTVEAGSNIDVRTFDLQNLSPTGRLRFVTEP